MKKILVSMFLLVLILLNLCSCSTVSDDNSIMHNGVKYYAINDISGYYNFIGSKHKVGTVLLLKGIKDLYCLDSDTDENIIFTGLYSPRYIWIKQGFSFPNKDTLIDKVYYKKSYEENNEKDIEIVNATFDSLFIEVEISNFEEFNSFGIINFLYYDNIEYSTFIYSDDFGNLYINVFDYDNTKDHYFKVVDDMLIEVLQSEKNNS